MSKFLAPIHSWLFNKILIMENIEKDIVKVLENNELKAFHNELVQNYGDFIPDESLESLIDQSNIHGWLQQRITISEQRQAELISKMMKADANAVEKISAIYESAGRKAAKNYGISLDNPGEVFKLLGDVLLEGMPCDRVNNVIGQQENQITWITSNCVHKSNWEMAGVDVENYYKFRESFSRGFVQEINPKMKYTYTLTDQQLHKITI